MAITIRYFASLRELVGRSEDSLEFENDLTVVQLWQRLNGTLAMPPNTLAAVNMEYMPLNTELYDGDVVAFFPPVTGG